MGKGHPSGLKLSQLRALVAVAEYGNFGEAAWQIGLTQPTVSHAISTLEDELGVILLSRGRHGAQLTPAGEAVTDRARDILHQLEVLQQTANRHKGLRGGRVRIAAFRGAAANLLPRTVAQFQADCPNVEVSITEFYDFAYVEQQVRSGKADIGISCLPTGHEFDSWEILRDPYQVLLPAKMAAEEMPPTWEQLTTWPLISYPEDNSCFADLNRCFQQAGYRLQPRFQFRETTTILNMVAQSLGVAIVPALSAYPIPSGITVRPLPVSLERIIGGIVLSNALRTPAVFAFMQQISQTDSTV